MNRTLDREMSDKVSFIIPKFAEEYKMGAQDAYLYFEKIWGIGFPHGTLVGVAYG
jgi:hypothetical protein